MSKYIKNQSSTDPWIIDESSQTWLLGRKATISVTGEPAIVVPAGNDGNLIKLKGDLEASGAGSEGLHIEGDDTMVRIARSSRIEAEDGIYIASSGSVIKNAGVIDGGERGIGSDSTLDIVNSGRISGETAVSLLGDSTVTNAKGGVIDGGTVGIRISTFGGAEIVNDGRIISDGLAVLINSAGDSGLINTGRIVGDVQFGAGNDRIDIAQGRVTGQVAGGLGSDIYAIGRKTFDLVENADGGYDTVYASASHALGDAFEVLWLAGERSIDGTGNELSNELIGNIGDNVLKGKDGNDRIIGHQGDDLLIGGDGQDHFVFTPGDDRDVIEGFDVTSEYIALLDFGFNSFDDVQPFLKQKGDDTWIVLGDGDRIILRDIDASSLADGSIVFNVPM